MNIFEKAGWTKYADEIPGSTVGESYDKKPLHLWVSERNSIKISASLGLGLFLMTETAMPASPEALQTLEGRMLVAKMGAEMML